MIHTSLTRYRSYKKQASCFCGVHDPRLLSHSNPTLVLFISRVIPFPSSRDRRSLTSLFILPPSPSPDSASCSGNRRPHLCPVSYNRRLAPSSSSSSSHTHSLYPPFRSLLTIQYLRR